MALFDKLKRDEPCDFNSFWKRTLTDAGQCGREMEFAKDNSVTVTPGKARPTGAIDHGIPA